MKKICYLIFMILLIVSIVSCGKRSVESKFDSDFNIVEKDEEYIGKSDDGKLVINNLRNNINISSTENIDSAEKISKFLNDYSDKEWKNICEETDLQVQAVNENYFELEDMADYYGIQLKISKLFENEKYISFTIKQDGSLGGVGWNSIKEFNFDKSNGEVLDVVNLVKDVEKFEKEMYEYCVEYIEKDTDLEEILWDDEISGNWKDIMKDQMFIDGSWGVIDSGIEFVFEKYVLGPGVAGTIVIDVPYKF